MVDRVNMYCYYCGHQSACEIHGQYSKEISIGDEEFPVVGYKIYEYMGYDYDEPDYGYKLEDQYTVKYMTGPEIESHTGAFIHAEIYWRLIQCLTCSYPMLERIIRVFARDYSSKTGEVEYEVPIVPIADILYPIEKIGDTPNPTFHMPKEVEAIFTEARTVFANSPRASAALLRLALQLLCKHLGQPGKDINEDIKALAKQGLPLETKQAMDIVRVLGNFAVHPGEINLNDTPKKVSYLFSLINYIVNQMIVRRSQINELYEELPEGKRKEIEKRDKK